MTDVERVLQLFRQYANLEFNHRKIVDDLRISEYTGRITDAREVLGCTCGKDKNTCAAREHIVNTRKGYYKFITPVKPFIPPMETLIDPEVQLEKLRNQYREARKNGDQWKMEQILKMVERIKKAEPSFEKLVQDTLLNK